MPQHDDGLTLRVATERDIPSIRGLMDEAIDALLGAVLPPDAVEASRAIMGLDTQLIADGTYFVVEAGPALAGCGGWSWRATLYGGDHARSRSDARLDPATDAARVRAMYTNPRFARRGVGRMIIAASEQAAADAGFTRVALASTAAGEPFYVSCGYQIDERMMDDTPSGIPVPLIHMSKSLSG